MSVLIPTHDHAATIEFAIKSVQKQTIKDFEILIVGDGQPSTTDDIIKRLSESDRRIKYFPNEKGAGYGELYRHYAIMQTAAPYICYLGDDDMWFDNHLEVMVGAMKKYNFVHTTHTNINRDESIEFFLGDLQDEVTRYRMLHHKFNFFGLSCAGHTLDLYLKLPFGWRPKADNVWSDLHMWRQILSNKHCTPYSILQSTTLKLPSDDRINLDLDDRLAELNRSWGLVRSNDFKIKLKMELSSFLKKAPVKSDWLRQVGAVLLKDGHHLLSEEAYLKSLVCTPTDVQSWCGLVNVKISNDRVEDIADVLHLYEMKNGKTQEYQLLKKYAEDSIGDQGNVTT